MQPPRNIKELLLRDNIFEKRRKTFENGIKRVAFFARIVYNTNDAEMAERSNAHDSKSCYAGMHTRVQIPFSAPCFVDKNAVHGKNLGKHIVFRGFLLFFGQKR